MKEVKNEDDNFINSLVFCAFLFRVRHKIMSRLTAGEC